MVILALVNVILVLIKVILVEQVVSRTSLTDVEIPEVQRNFSFSRTGRVSRSNLTDVEIQEVLPIKAKIALDRNYHMDS